MLRSQEEGKKKKKNKEAIQKVCVRQRDETSHDGSYMHFWSS